MKGIFWGEICFDLYISVFLRGSNLEMVVNGEVV